MDRLREDFDRDDRRDPRDVALHAASNKSDMRRQNRCQSPIHALGSETIMSKLQLRLFASKHIRPLPD
jgi:hypothetical protein